MIVKQKEKKRKSWEDHIRQWRLSGQSQAEYCRQHKLSAKCFYYWKRRLDPKNKTISFVKLPNSVSFSEQKNIHSNNTLKILINNDIKIELNDNFNPVTLKKVVETLRSMG